MFRPVALALLLFLGLVPTSPARAGDAPADDAGEEEDDLSENTLTGKRPVASGADSADAEIIAWMNRPHHADSYRAAEALKSDVKMLDESREAVELVYKRKLKEARKSFDDISKKYPTTGIGPLGTAIIYQALMFENFDWRYEKQYGVAYKQIRAQLDAGAKKPGDEGLESFVLASAHGLDAINTMRKGDYLPALNRAMEALKALEKTKELAPAFSDVQLGDGLFLYWRTVVSQNSKAIPDTGDKRAEGMEAMKKAENTALFLGPASTLALAYSYIEERNLRMALDRCLHTRLAYPDNVINNMTLGRIYTSMRRYPEALRMYTEILEDAPENQRAHYHQGVVLARMGEYDKALVAYQTYLGFKDIPKEARGQTLYRLGALYVRQKQYDKAETYFKQSISETGNEAAKHALERMRKQK